MKKSVLLLVTLVATLQSSLFAQRITDDYSRFYAGLSLAFIFDVEGVADKGADVGWIYAFNPTRGRVPLFLQAGGEVIYEYDSEEDVTEDLVCVAVPLNVSYKLGNDRFNVEPFAGVNFRFNVYGHVNSTRHGVFDIDYFDSWSDELEAQRFQFGANFGLNINYLRASLGLRVNPDFADYFKSTRSKTRRVLITMGYSF